MSQGNVSILAKNLKNFLPGMAALAGQASPAFATWKKIYDRQRKHGPADFVDQHETYSADYWKRFHSQEKNMWVDADLASQVSQKEIAQLMTFKQDLWRVLHAAWPVALFGGYALPFWLLWLGNNTWVPSTFTASAEEAAEYRASQDLYRYKFVPAYLTDTKWFFDFHAFPWNAEQERAWDEVFEKNDVHRDPARARLAACMYDGFIKFEIIRRRSLRCLTRSMGIPSFPFWSRLCQGTRVRDYWELAWNEDFMVIKGKLHETMSDADLHDYAWRRFLAPYDKGLTRADVLQRVEDYHTFLGPKFVESGVAPNIQILTAYVMGYYNDPAFLVGDISELDTNDYEHLAAWGKDAFLRRLEFENGPLRDQVEAHSQKLTEQREKAKEAAVAAAAPTPSVTA